MDNQMLQCSNAIMLDEGGKSSEGESNRAVGFV